ncbi:MAG: hypothetical protein ACTSX1_15755 [Candidatus Heimdallarchaeaceae archaeon]
MFNTILIIFGVVAGIGLLIKALKIVFRKDPIPEGCLCKHTRLSIDINYDCPLHGDWR